MAQRVPAARWCDGDRMYGMCALPGGRLFVGGSGGGDIKVYDPRNGRLETKLPAAQNKDGVGGHSDAVLAITYNSLGVFSAGADLIICQWDHQTFECVRTFTGHKGLIAALCVIPSDYGTGLFSGSDDRTIKQWNTNTGKCVFTYKGHKSAVNCLAASDRWLFSGSKGVIKVWSISGRKCQKQIEAHTDAVWALKLMPDGKLVSGSSDSTIKIWDDPVGRAECLRVLTGHQGQVRNLHIHGSLMFSCSKDGTVAVWNLSTWKAVEVLSGHEKTVTCMTLQNNQLCTCSFDKHINRWDVTDLLDPKQPITQFIPYDVERVAQERKRRQDDVYHVHDEQRFYNKEKKKMLVKMDPRDAVFQYDALPLNFVIDKLEYKCKSSQLLLDSFLYVPFLVMFIFFFLVNREIEQSYFITRAAVDLMEGNEIYRQPWCTLPDGSPWNNPGTPGLPIPRCDPDNGVLKVAKRFGDIANAGDFNDWAMSVMFPALFPGAWSSIGEEKRNPPMSGGKYLVGALRLRTIRVANDSCDVNEGFFGPELDTNPELREFYETCYGSWSPGATATEPYACIEPSTCLRAPYPTGKFNRSLLVSSQKGASKEWSERWFAEDGFRYFSKSEVGGTGTAGQVGDRLWPAGGYVVEVPFSSSPNDAQDMLAIVMDNGFVDNIATRFVTVEYMTYTPYANYFTAHKFFVEVATGGAWLSEGVIKNFRVWTSNQVPQTVYDFFFLAFVLYYCVNFIRDWYTDYKISRSAVKFIFGAWNILELANLVAFLVVFGFRFKWWSLSLKHDDELKMPSVSTHYPSVLDEILDAYMMQVWTNSVNTVLTFLKLLKFVRLNDRLNILTRTLAACQQSILGVLVLFVWVVFGFAITGNTVFGGGIFEFRSINASFSTLLRHLLGDFDYPALREENKQMAAAFFWSFQVLGLFLLLNFLIAVISDAFADVSGEQTFIDLDATLAKTLNDVKSECLPSSIQRKWRLLKHRKTQTGLLMRVHNEMKEYRNKMMSDEDIEAQEHREQLANVFVHKDDYMNTIPADIVDDLSEEFLYRVWLDIAWEYNKEQRDEYFQSSEKTKELIQEKAAEHVMVLREHMAVIQDMRGRFDDLESRVRPLVQSWQARGRTGRGR
eukprot:Sspe_Gene.47686::Locus_24438_Transcript_2_3_Confidence_0.286_Length_3554::g.47686::m.47686